MTREHLILSYLSENEEYARQVLPFIQVEYFSERSDKLVFELISNYIVKYNRCPTKEALIIDLNEKEGIQDDVFKSASSLLSSLKIDDKTSLEFVRDSTERWCQDRAIYNALMSSISIIENKDEKVSRGSIPQILTDALAVSFDSSIGHDYLSDWEERFEYYRRVENKIPFDLEMFNTITGGGLPKKSLTIFLAGPHVGKTMTMCHCAAYNLYSGKNVLYITLEMSEEAISKRIDSNLLNIPIEELDTYPKEMFEKKIAQVRGKTRGQLIVKEYPTASASVANFRHLLNELKLKKKFVPDIIYVDYMNICASARIKRSAGANMYEYVKSIGEELRGLAVEFDAPMVTASQVNREGGKSSDFDMTDIAESYATGMTSDAIFALIATDELKEMNQILVKQLKNRFSDLNNHTRFVIGVDRPTFKLHDVEQGMTTEKPIMDSTKFGERFNLEEKMNSKFDHSQFVGLN